MAATWAMHLSTCVTLADRRKTRKQGHVVSLTMVKHGLNKSSHRCSDKELHGDQAFRRIVSESRRHLSVTGCFTKGPRS